MKIMRRSRLLFLATLSGILTTSDVSAQSGWPEAGSEQKPWTRWWWLGSGVDEENLTRELEAFAKAGLGGVEICPIYGAKGYEDRDRMFLSNEWMAALAHTTTEAKRLGLGVDLTTGTGWPFGGAWVGPETASHDLVRIEAVVKGGERMRRDVSGTVIALQAHADDGRAPLDLAGFVKQQRLDWEAPQGGPWRVLGLTSKSPIQQVKRAAPGGAGPVLDPYSAPAMKQYLSRFDEAFARYRAPYPRAHFHDSFEYYGAEWSPNLEGAFEKHHGYRLAGELPAFFADGEKGNRVRADWRTTLSLMHRDYLRTWRNWANGAGARTRNQAHGSPGNVLDHYAVADIPETEIFREVGEDQIPMMGLAASAAHATGRPLVSAESFTWLDEHFRVKPGRMKEAVDFLFLGGVNHLFYHGVPYSPEDAGWPGWLFYASTHMGPNGGLWKEMPAFNAYVSRVQSLLQGGRPDSEVLLYFPFDDLIAESGDELPLFTIHNQNDWLHGSPYHDAAMAMWNHGIPHTAVSSSLLEQARVEEGNVVLGEVRAKVVLVPGARLLPVGVLHQLRELGRSGIPVVFLGERPGDVPGNGRLDARREQFNALLRDVDGWSRQVKPDRVVEVLAGAGVSREGMTEQGLRLVRRVRDDGHDYFVVNRGSTRIDRYVELARAFKSVMLMDPSLPDRWGAAESRSMNGRPQVRLVLEPGESVVVRTWKEQRDIETRYPYRDEAGLPTELTGSWKVEFIEGGPVLPEEYECERLESWTKQNDPALKSFSGTARFTHRFEHPEGESRRFLLDLGRVECMCRVTLNGEPLGSSFFPPHIRDLGELLRPGENVLEVEVTNLAANRIADLDRKGVDWKNFHEINFVNIDYKLFDASGWAPLPSGLLGPVRLVPLR